MKKTDKISGYPYFQSDTLMTVLLFGLLLMPLIIIGFSIKKDEPYLAYILLLFSGWLSWTFIEYFNHRFRMHGSGDPSKVIGYQRHILHHHHPTEIKITAQFPRSATSRACAR